MSQKLLSIVSISGLFLLLGASSAQAAPFKDAAGKVHIQTGLTAGQKISIASDQPITKTVIFNQCGIALLGAPSSTIPMPAGIMVNGSAVDVASLPSSPTPKCALVAGAWTPSIALTANARATDGKVILLGTPNTGAAATYDGVFKSRTVTANQCGLVSFGSVASPAPATFDFAGSPYTTASLAVEIPKRCIKTAPTTYTTFAPQ